MDLIIKSLQEQHSYSQDELAQELGISRQTYIKYENGSCDMPLEIVRKLSKLFDVDYSCLIDNFLPSDPLEKPDLTLLSIQELEFIDSVLEKHSDKTATELSAFSHKDIPWLGAKDKEVLDYEAVFYRTPATFVRCYEEEGI